MFHVEHCKHKQQSQTCSTWNSNNMKRMENIFDLSKNGAKKVYIDGELFPIRVGMREISLQNGEKVLVYDTSGP